MCARLHRDGGCGETLRQRGEALAGVGDRFLADDFTRRIEDAHRVPAIPDEARSAERAQS
jgi:hypothetical protein